jgi:hypothetical protein
LREWNNLKTTNLDIGDKLVIYVEKSQKMQEKPQKITKNTYIVKKRGYALGNC